MDFKIPEYISRIIREVDSRNSKDNDINKAIRFLVKKLHKQNEFEEFKKKLEKLKKESDKEKEKIYFLEYLNKEFLKQQREYEARKKRNEEMRKVEHEERKKRKERNEERRKIEHEERRKAEKKFQKQVDLQINFDSLDLDYIKLSLSDYILADLKQLFQEQNNSEFNNLKTKKNIHILYKSYKQLIDNIESYFRDLWTNSVAFIFKRNYDFKSDSDLFKLEKLKNVLERFNQIKESNYEINLAEIFLNEQTNENEYENIILAVKIAHTIFMKYIAEFNENFKKLREEFNPSFSDELIYVALFLNNNYIDGARTFIETKKNSGNEEEENLEEEENVVPQSEFTTAIYNIKTSRNKTEAEIIEEYDDEVNKLNEDKQNVIRDGEDNYYILDFINNCLSNEDFYPELDNLYNYIKAHLVIPNMKLLETFRKKLNYDLNNFKKIYIKYKIFEGFLIKFNEILTDYSDVKLMYKSNKDMYDMFIKLILSYSIYSSIGNIIIDLNVYLKIIACVILHYYTKSNNSNIIQIITQKITNSQEKKIAIDYIIQLSNLFKEKENIEEEGYFKLFAKLREYPFYSKKSQPILPYNNRTRNQPPTKHEALANKFMEGHERTLPKLGLGSVKKPTYISEESSQKNSQPTKSKSKKKATDEDKKRLINETFEKMVNIDLSNKIIEPEHFRLGCNQTSLTTLQTIYEKNNQSFNQLRTILLSLKSNINIDKKKKEDNCSIFDSLKNLYRLLDIIKNILTSTVSREKESIIKSLFEKILENIEKYIEIYKELCSNNEKTHNVYINNDKVSECLKILDIDIQEFSELDKNEKIKEIKKSYKRLALEKHPNKVKQNSSNMNKNQENQATAVFQEIGKAYLYLSEIYSNGEVNTENVKLNMGFKTGKPSTSVVLSSKSLSLKNKNLLDIIVENLSPSLMEYLSLKHKLKEFLKKQITNLNFCYSLFTPFNALFDDNFDQKKNPNDKFILLLNNDKVKRFFSSLTNAIDKKDNERYEQFCHNIQLFIRYINYDIEFINSKEKLNELTYYNFFHNLNNVIQIILKSLTQENPNYPILKFVQTALGTIVILMKNNNKDLYEFNIEKNNTGTVRFAPNRVNVRKFGKENVKEFKIKIKDEISVVIQENNNSLENLTPSLLDELIRKMNDKYEITMDFLLHDEETIKEKLKSFFDKLKSNLSFSKNNFNKLNENLLFSVGLIKNLVMNMNNYFEIIHKQFIHIIELVIKSFLNKLTKLNKVKDIKDSILEFLYIYVISFSKQEQFKIFQNIKNKKKQIKKSNVNVEGVLSEINKRQQEQMRLNTIKTSLKEFEKGLKGTAANNNQKLLAYETKAKELFKTKSANELRSFLSIVNSPLARKYMNYHRILLTEGKSSKSNVNNKNVIMEKIKKLFQTIVTSENENTLSNYSTKNSKDRLNKLFNELIKMYKISFSKLANLPNLDDIIRSFFDKINKLFVGMYKKDYVDLLIRELHESNKKDDFLKKEIIIPVIMKVIRTKIKILESYNNRKNNILELLFIFVESFSYPKPTLINNSRKVVAKNTVSKNTVSKKTVPNNTVPNNINQEKVNNIPTILKKLKDYENSLSSNSYTKVDLRHKLILYEREAKKLFKTNKSTDIKEIIRKIQTPLAIEYIRVFGSPEKVNNNNISTPSFKKNSDIVEEVVIKLIQKLPKNATSKSKIAYRQKIDNIIEKIQSNNTLNISSIEDYIEEVRKRLSKK